MACVPPLDGLDFGCPLKDGPHIGLDIFTQVLCSPSDALDDGCQWLCCRVSAAWQAPVVGVVQASVCCCNWAAAARVSGSAVLIAAW